MENKQTVVDFLEESIHLHCLIDDSEDVIIDYNTLSKLFMAAKAMEKQQIINARVNGDENHTFNSQMREEYANDYYNKTYGNE